MSATWEGSCFQVQMKGDKGNEWMQTGQPILLLVTKQIPHYT